MKPPTRVSDRVMQISITGYAIPIRTDDGQPFLMQMFGTDDLFIPIFSDPQMWLRFMATMPDLVEDLRHTTMKCISDGDEFLKSLEPTEPRPTVRVMLNAYKKPNGAVAYTEVVSLDGPTTLTPFDAVIREAPDELERAVVEEPSERTERVDDVAPPAVHERVDEEEAPVNPERVESADAPETGERVERLATPEPSERAEQPEAPDSPERADKDAVPPSPCPSCFKVMDRATDGLRGGGRPRPGDVTVCINCGALLRFGEQLQLGACGDVEDLLLADLIDADGARLIRVMQVEIRRRGARS
jgi:hypothetical protein